MHGHVDIGDQWRYVEFFRERREILIRNMQYDYDLIELDTLKRINLISFNTLPLDISVQMFGNPFAALGARTVSFHKDRMYLIGTRSLYSIEYYTNMVNHIYQLQPAECTRPKIAIVAGDWLIDFDAGKSITMLTCDLADSSILVMTKFIVIDGVMTHFDSTNVAMLNDVSRDCGNARGCRSGELVAVTVKNDTKMWIQLVSCKRAQIVDACVVLDPCTWTFAGFKSFGYRKVTYLVARTEVKIKGKKNKRSDFEIPVVAIFKERLHAMQIKVSLQICDAMAVVVMAASRYGVMLACRSMPGDADRCCVVKFKV